MNRIGKALLLIATGLSVLLCTASICLALMPSTHEMLNNGIVLNQYGPKFSLDTYLKETLGFAKEWNRISLVLKDPCETA
jgi:hypothetical protein